MTDLRHVHDGARELVTVALQRDPGPLATAISDSRYGYLGSDLPGALEHPRDPVRASAGTLRDLAELIDGRTWWSAG